MTTRALVTFACLTVLASSQLSAQNTLLAESQPAKYTAPLCPLKPNNKGVEKAIDQLKKSYDAKTPAEKQALLDQAKTGLTAAISQESQDKNPAAWYYLARVALLQGDARGADSAFTKAVELNNSCEYDISTHRQNSWAAVANPGLEAMRAGKHDSALALFREANYLFREMPHVYSYMGVAFANTEQPDSAAKYFETALKIAEPDTALVEDRNAAALNLGLMYQRLERHQDAMVTLRKYLGWNPTDNDARKALAITFRTAGMEDSARAIENAMVEEFSKSNLDSLSMQDLMAVGVAAFNAEQYAQAENAFKKAVERNPWSRDARYNLANTYLAMKNHEGLIAQGTKLLEMEPLNEDVLRLLAQGQRGLKQDEAVVKTAERLVALPFSIEISSFQMGASSSRLMGEATGRTPLDPKGNPLKAAPVTVALEFLDQSGAVVATQEFTVPVLKEGEKHPIQQDGNAANIAGWRYRVK